MKKPIILGIDIGIGNNTGVAEYLCKEKKFTNISSMDIFDALELCLKYERDPNYTLIAVIENTDLDSNVFGAGERVLAYTKYSWQKNRNDKLLLSQIRSAIKQGSNVGKNQGLCKTFIMRLEAYGIKYVEIAPSDRERYPKEVKVGKGKNRKTLVVGGKIQYVPWNQLKMPTKLPSEHFKQKSGYDGNTNEHGRDGGTMLLGGKKDYFYWSNYARNQKAERDAIEKAKKEKAKKAKALAKAKKAKK
jgi:hypothetical protein